MWSDINEIPLGKIMRVTTVCADASDPYCDAASRVQKTKRRRAWLAYTSNGRELRGVLKSATWGALDGALTGSWVGVSVTGSGWWVVGALTQAVGCFTGLLLGGALGGTAGAVIKDIPKTASLIREYRLSYGRSVAAIVEDNRSKTTIVEPTGAVIPKLFGL